MLMAKSRSGDSEGRARMSDYVRPAACGWCAEASLMSEGERSLPTIKTSGLTVKYLPFPQPISSPTDPGVNNRNFSLQAMAKKVVRERRGIANYRVTPCSGVAEKLGSNLLVYIMYVLKSLILCTRLFLLHIVR